MQTLNVRLIIPPYQLDPSILFFSFYDHLPLAVPPNIESSLVEVVRWILQIITEPKSKDPMSLIKEIWKSIKTPYGLQILETYFLIFSNSLMD